VSAGPTSRGELHDDAQVVLREESLLPENCQREHAQGTSECCRAPYLLELHDVRVNQGAMVDDFSLHILGYLLDERNPSIAVHMFLAEIMAGTTAAA
jgi:hypothetical protein